MAKLNLLPRKEFEIILDGKVIHGKYGLWAMKRFCDKRGLTLQKLTEYMNTENLTIDVVQDILLCSVEFWHRENKKPFEYTDIDACNWIDALGGLMGEEYLKLSNHAASVDEKKNQEETPSDGKNSSVYIMRPEERTSGDQLSTKSGTE